MLKFLIKIKDRAKKLFDKINNEQLKTNLLQALPFWVASVITGLAAVLYAKLFEWTQNANTLIFGVNKWLLFGVTPVCFVFAWWIVRKYAPFARGSGIPQVMAAIDLSTPKDHHKVNRLLSLKNILVKVLSSLVLVFGGGAIGREGPTIQIAGSIFREVNRWLPSWWPQISKKNMILTGAAGGLAAAFNTPLGGIVFAVEELSKTHINQFKTAVFTSVIIAGMTAQAFLGPYLYLGYPNVSNLSGYIFFGVASVAILSGVMGSLMSKAILFLFKWKSKFKHKHQYFLYVLVCSLVIVALAIFVDHGVMGSGKDMMESVLFSSENHLDFYNPILRIVGPILSFTTGAAGGIFAPSLSAGASIGSLIAGFFDMPTADTNILILAGMVGFLTGVTRTPFTSAILVLEMTDRHSVIFHLMLAGLLASVASLLIDRRSFYDHLKEKYMDDVHKENGSTENKEEPPS